MHEHEVSRTLLKSPPELWTECSDASSLARHLGAFGEIRITRLEPDAVVHWEGERARGTVRLEPAGWGTKVILTARAVSQGGPGASAEGSFNAGTEPRAAAGKDGGAAEADARPEPATGPLPRPRRGVFGTLVRLLRLTGPSVRTSPDADATVSPESDAPVSHEPDAPVGVGPEVERALGAALDNLGKAHHRPFSRA